MESVYPKWEQFIPMLIVEHRLSNVEKGVFSIGFTRCWIEFFGRFSILRNYPQDRYKFTRYYWYARRLICRDR